MKTAQDTQSGTRLRCEIYASASAILTMLAFGVLGIAWMMSFAGLVVGRDSISICLIIASPFAAMVGFLLGVLSWWTGRKGKLSASGRKKALFGRLFSGLYLVLVFFVIYFVHVAGQNRLEHNLEVRCLNNLKRLNFAAMLYAQDNDGHFPPQDEWQNALRDYCNMENCSKCPDDPSGEVSYVYLGDSVMTISSDKFSGDIPLFRERDNFHSKFHKGKFFACFMDGTTRAISPDELEDAIQQSRLKIRNP